MKKRWLFGIILVLILSAIAGVLIGRANEGSVQYIPLVVNKAAFGKGINASSYTGACDRAKQLGARHISSWNPNWPSEMETEACDGLTFSACYCDDFDIGQPLQHNSGVCYYLNEPEANDYSPQYAASLYPTALSYAEQYGCEMSAPRMTSTDREWLPAFLDAIPPEQYPRIFPFHCYQGFEPCVEAIEWLEALLLSYGITDYVIHITEFSVRHCWWPDWAQQTADLVNYFEIHPRIDKYFFFADVWYPGWGSGLPGCGTPAFDGPTGEITAQGWNYQHLPGVVVPYP